MKIFGENHQSHTSISTIEAYIRKNPPRVLIHELVEDFSGSLKDVSKKDLKKIPQYVKGLNEDIFELALELDIPVLLGCDLSTEDMDKLKDAPMPIRFARREARMVSFVKRFQGQDDVIMVVGDIHLREKPNDDLPEISEVVKAINDKNYKVEIVRAPKGLREAD